MHKILLLGSSGYIGSALVEYLGQKYEVRGVDFKTPPNHDRLANLFNNDYDSLTKEDIKEVDAVILLAGLSSVAMCEGKLTEAVYQNVSKFTRLIEKIPAETPFLFASSASVYGKKAYSGESAFKENQILRYPINIYDATKQHIDHYMQFSDINHWYALRFGTVCGYSSNMRIDLMLNSMFYTAKTKGHFYMANGDNDRAVLGMQDLCRAVETILEAPRDYKKGYYNLASFNKTVRELSHIVSKYMNVPILGSLDKGTYSYELNTANFESYFNFKFQETPETILQSLEKMDIDAIMKNENEYRRL